MEQREGGTNLSSSSVVTESNSPARSAGKAKVEQPTPLLAHGTSFVTASVIQGWHFDPDKRRASSYFASGYRAVVRDPRHLVQTPGAPFLARPLREKWEDREDLLASAVLSQPMRLHIRPQDGVDAGLISALLPEPG